MPRQRQPSQIFLCNEIAARCAAALVDSGVDGGSNEGRSVDECLIAPIALQTRISFFKPTPSLRLADNLLDDPS
jgi:hypothetical protein